MKSAISSALLVRAKRLLGMRKDLAKQAVDSVVETTSEVGQIYQGVGEVIAAAGSAMSIAGSTFIAVSEDVIANPKTRKALESLIANALENISERMVEAAKVVSTATDSERIGQCVASLEEAAEQLQEKLKKLERLGNKKRKKKKSHLRSVEE